MRGTGSQIWDLPGTELKEQSLNLGNNTQERWNRAWAWEWSLEESVAR